MVFANFCETSRTFSHVANNREEAPFRVRKETSPFRVKYARNCAFFSPGGDSRAEKRCPETGWA